MEASLFRRALHSPALPGLLILVLMTAAVQPLFAHAVLMQSKPAINSSVKGPNVPIGLRFNVRVDGKRSHLQLIAPDGSTMEVPAPKQTAPDVLESSVTGLKPGAYKLQWRVLASDGHMSNGVVDFTVN